MEEKIKLNIAVLTISDSRTKKTDKSGNLLTELISNSIQNIADHQLVKHNIYSIRKKFLN